MVTTVRISLSWGGSPPYPNLPVGVRHISEIMPAVLAFHGLEMPDDLGLEGSPMTGTPIVFDLLIVAIKAVENLT